MEYEMLKGYGDILSVGDLQKVFCIGKNRAYELVEKNIIKSFRMGKIYKIPKKAVIDYLLESMERGMVS